MTKISLDPEQQEIEITRSIGKGGDGKITIDREGGGSIEIDLGIASFGVTTDYGGAISLGIAGQEVTWGREGGTIHIGIGGFNVDVEARDCVVTEIKSIAGIIVAQRSYPDPGCKVPDPPKLPNPPKPPENPRIENEIELPDTDEEGWVSYSEIIKSYGWNNQNKIVMFDSATVTRDVSNVIKNPTSYFTRLPYTSTIVSTNSAYYPSITVVQGTFLTSELLSVRKYTTGLTDIGSVSYPVLTRYVNFRTSRICFFGRAKEIKKFISDYNAEHQKYYEGLMATTQPPQGFHAHHVVELIATGFIPVKETPPLPFLPTGNKPPMKDCCEEILDYLADFEEAFEIQKLLKDKFPVSNTFMAPECDPASVTRAKSYYEIMQCVFRMMAHGMIFEPRVEIKDADAAKAGDQEFKARYLNATGWASAMAEALLEVKDDGNVSTNMDIRNGFAVTQTMVGVADAIYRLEAILDCLGIELIPRAETVETPYNLQIQIGKGFGEGNERQIDLNTDEATEKLLPSLLQTKKNKIKTVDIHPRSRSIREILENIEVNLPGATNS